MNYLKTLALGWINPIAKLYRGKFLGLSHQRKHIERTQQKWRLIAGELTGPPGSLLDIGCNEGYFTLRAAEMGWCAWGVEPLTMAANYARQRAVDAGLGNALFFNGPLTPEATHALPTFDVILFLSSFHDLHKKFGSTQANAVFGNLLAACRRKILLEPASTSSRFSKDAPVFARDNDRDAIQEWIHTLVADAPEWTVRYIGATPYGELEPFRFLFSIERRE